MGIRRKTEEITGVIDRILLVAGCVFLAVMMIQITADVFLRSVLDTYVPATLELVSYYYMVLAVFLPLSYVERKHAHIEVDLFTQFMPAKIRFGLYLFACMVGLCFFGILTYQAFLDAVKATEHLQTVMSNFIFYVWPSRWALPLGFAAACLAIVNNMLSAIARREAL